VCTLTPLRQIVDQALEEPALPDYQYRYPSEAPLPV